MAASSRRPSWRSPTRWPRRAGSRWARRRGCRWRSSGASGSSRHRHRRPRWSARRRRICSERPRSCRSRSAGPSGRSGTARCHARRWRRPSAPPAPRRRRITRPWSFTAIWTAAAKRRLLRAIADAWREDLQADATPEATIERRIARSDAVLGAAPVLIVPWVRFRGAHPYADAERSHAEREMFLLSGGAAIQNLLLALGPGTRFVLDLLDAVLPAGESRRPRDVRRVVRARDRRGWPDAGGSRAAAAPARPLRAPADR